jgi:hypothetical protein
VRYSVCPLKLHANIETLKKFWKEKTHWRSTVVPVMAEFIARVFSASWFEDSKLT